MTAPPTATGTAPPIMLAGLWGGLAFNARDLMAKRHHADSGWYGINLQYPSRLELRLRYLSPIGRSPRPAAILADHSDATNLAKIALCFPVAVLSMIGFHLLDTVTLHAREKSSKYAAILWLISSQLDHEDRDVSRRHHQSPTVAMKPAGQDPETRPCRPVEQNPHYRSVHCEMPVLSG